MNSGRVIVASTGERSRRDLRSALEFHGHEVVEVDSAAETVQKACWEPHDVLIMDSVLDGITAYRLCRAIRPKSEIGIIVLDGAGDNAAPHNAIDALNAGADDHVSAPVVMEELMSRVRAIMRRIGRRGPKCVTLHDRTIDLNSHKVEGPDGRASHLTPKEFLVLQCLVTHAGKPRTHQYLSQAVWNRDGNGDLEYLRVVVNQLRRKLEPEPQNPRYILTEPFVGYRFQPPPQ